MSDDKKYILCPKCGVILEKGVIHCSYCGANVEEKVQDDFYQKPVESKPIPPAQSQTSYRRQGGFGKQSAHTQEQEYVLDSDMGKRLVAEDYVRKATMFAYLAMCIPYISVIFLVITIVFVMQARKVLGRGDPRLSRAIMLAVFGTLTDVAYIIVFINYYSSWFG
ncbi:MAG: zinc ribbon domain-containing protein [Asgard group archaeon]|nr:zinc ribbon domain-containing protein [Asgard group archaeon]